MCILIMYYFTMESFEIIQELEQNIVIEIKRFIRNLLLKYKKCGIANNQLSYCEQNIRDNCHSGGYLCSKRRRFMRTEKNCIKTAVC